MKALTVVAVAVILLLFYLAYAGATEDTVYSIPPPLEVGSNAAGNTPFVAVATTIDKPPYPAGTTQADEVPFCLDFFDGLPVYSKILIQGKPKTNYFTNIIRINLLKDQSNLVQIKLDTNTQKVAMNTRFKNAWKTEMGANTGTDKQTLFTADTLFFVQIICEETLYRVTIGDTFSVEYPQITFPHADINKLTISGSITIEDLTVLRPTCIQ